MIAEVWQYGDNPDHLVLCVKTDWGLEVVNGFYVLTEDRKKEYEAKFKGLIEWPWVDPYHNEHYDITLQRFQNGERAQFIVCSCCDVGSWRNEKGEKIKEASPEEYPYDDEDDNE